MTPADFEALVRKELHSAWVVWRSETDGKLDEGRLRELQERYVSFALHAAWDRELDDLKEIAARWMTEGVTQKERADAAEARVGGLELDIEAWAKTARTVELHLLSANARLAALTEDGKRYRDALNEIACWGEGPQVSGKFDEPASAQTARAALAADEEGKG